MSRSTDPAPHASEDDPPDGLASAESAPSRADPPRAARLAAALKANLGKRKLQAKAREQAADHLE